MKTKTVIQKFILLFFLVCILVPRLAVAKADNLILLTLDGTRWQEIFTGIDLEYIPYERIGDAKVKRLVDETWSEDQIERRNKLMPHLWNELVPKGQIMGDPESGVIFKVQNQHFLSGPGYNEMLVGKPDKSFARQGTVNNPNVTVLEWLNQQAKFQNKVAAITSWENFKYILNRQRNPMYINAGREFYNKENATDKQKFINSLIQDADEKHWPYYRYDLWTYNVALDYLKVEQPKVLYIALDDSDEYGHEDNYVEYIKTIRKYDNMIKELWETVQAMPGYKNNTNLIVTTDHGRGATPADWKDHNKHVPASQYIWAFAIGPDIKPIGIYSSNKETLYQGQIASTVASLLGLGKEYQQHNPDILPSLANLG